MRKEQQLLEEAYENVMQNQHNQAKETFYKNIFGKFMNESSLKTAQGFQPWFDQQMQDGKRWNNDSLYENMHLDLEKKKIVPSSREELFKELNEFVLRNIASDERAWSVEA